MNEIETMIINSLNELKKVECINESPKKFHEKLVFPVKRDDSIRISEQEARIMFIRQLDKAIDTQYKYAIEAPTYEPYKFNGEKGRSGNIDLCIYNENGKRISLIEFKALNPQQFSYSKDFEKLLFDGKKDEELKNYFIQILINIDNGTIGNIKKKYMKALDNLKSKYYKAKDNNEEISKSQLKIFLFNIGINNKNDDHKIMQYEVDDNFELRDEIIL